MQGRAQNVIAPITFVKSAPFPSPPGLETGLKLIFFLFCSDLSTVEPDEAFSDLEIGDSDEEILNKINPNENEEEGQLQVIS